MEQRRNIPIATPETGQDEWQAVAEPLMSGWLTQGPQVKAFEEAFAARHGVAHALATTSATTGLHLALAGLGVGPGDEVIVPSFTWVATANAVLYCGATPILADVSPVTFNIDVEDVARKLTPRTRAVIPVHLFGLCAQMDALAEVVGDVPMIEDAACAAGSSDRGRPAGSLGRAGVFSFHPRKVLTTGEGGMVTTNDAGLAEVMEALRSHGGTVPVEARAGGGPKPHLMADFNLLGFNYRMTDIQAAVGRVQLAKLDPMVARRQELATAYHEALGSIPWLRTPVQPDGDSVCAWQSYVCFVDEARAPMSRNAIMARLAAQGVATRPGTHAIHMLGLYRERFGYQPDDLPGARDADRFSMAIPLHNRMSDDDCQYVIDALRAIG